jgi:alpha-1,2-rhamnosyltransferase
LKRPNKIRIFIECTHTFFNGGNSGIQRVVRNLANHSSSIKITEAEVNPIIWTGLGFCQLKAKARVRPYILIRIQKRFRQLFYFKPTKKSGWLKACISRLAKLMMLQGRIVPTIRFIQELSYFLMGLGYVPARLLFGRFVSFRQGDIIVLVDSTWRSHAMHDTLFKAQHDQGVKLGAMFHDLFPLLLPDTCDEITTKGFVGWFNRIVPRADFFVTNSEATRLSLRLYLDANPQLRPSPYVSGSFRLGAELDHANGRKRKSRYLQPLWDTPGRGILSIGTIEPRKNHAYTLDVFDILRQRDSNVSLIIIGRPGWKNYEILNRIRNHPDFGTRLLYFDNASDRDLAEAIERSDCLVCSSFAEGFGLPVVEGLMRGLEVFASDIPSFREIGSDHCHFFDLKSPVFLADQLENWFASPRSVKAITTENGFSWPDWEKSTRELIQLTFNLTVGIQSSPSLQVTPEFEQK